MAEGRDHDMPQPLTASWPLHH